MNIELSLEKLKSYIESNDYYGYDPYDGLKSPIFSIPILRSNKWLRFGTQQFVKRFPINLRPLFLIPKGYNPVTLGLSVQAYAYLFQAKPENKEEYLHRIDILIEELKKLIPKGYHGACWGYDFDWEARNAKIPAYQPTVVATGIITNALFIAYQITGNKEAASLVKSAAVFVAKDLNRTYTNQSFCFSYSPFDKQQVFNASMKGARLLAQAYYLNENNDYKELASQAVNFVVLQQKEDGSWGYSLAISGGWTDNYHTGYVLDCLDEYQKLTNDMQYAGHLKKGYDFYVEHFFDENGFPFFYSDKKYPLDCTAASQAILTNIRFANLPLANNVAQLTIQKMQKKNGSFRFRKFKNYTISTSFMRWSDAWMFAALSYTK
jgi:hypothetical protein